MFVTDVFPFGSLAVCVTEPPVFNLVSPGCCCFTGIFHENECYLNQCPQCGHCNSVTAVQSSLCVAGYKQPDSSRKNRSWVEDFLQFQAAVSSAHGLHQLAL